MSLRSMVIVTALMALFFALLIYGFGSSLADHNRRNEHPARIAIGKEQPGPEKPGPAPEQPGPGVEVCPQTLPECKGT